MVGAGALNSTKDNFDSEFASSEKVNEVDIFISHAWTSDRWLKYAALCYDLNFHLALGVSITTWMSVIGFLVMGGISTWGGEQVFGFGGRLCSDAAFLHRIFLWTQIELIYP